jgi:hypothetical protein
MITEGEWLHAEDAALEDAALEDVEPAAGYREQRKADICPKCNGDGIILNSTYRRNNGRCDLCGGSGKRSAVYLSKAVATAEKAVASPSTSTNKLKAEIAALVDSIVVGQGVGEPVEMSFVVRRLRELC